MYNDEHNLYHYTYRKDGSERPEPVSVEPTYSPAAETASPEIKPKRGGAKKLIALALCCVLLGGAAGGAAVWAAGRNSGSSNSSGSTQVSVSTRTADAVTVKNVDGKTAMSDADVYRATVNSVVSINITGIAGYNFYGQPVESAASGSGFILSTDGYIVTNYHVVEDAETVKVTLYNGETYDATYIGGDKDYDIAVIKIEASGLQAVTLGDSSTLSVGDRVLAIGNPLGELTFSMSGGMVSSANRAINVSGTPFNMIQTDASINPGNSGGPMFNIYGEVVGIVSAKYSSSAMSSSGSIEGIGFAIPINDVYAMIQDIITNGYVTNKPYLGITGGSMTAQMAAQYRFDQETGVFVYSVEEGGAADKAGFEMGDIITKIDDNEIKTMNDLTAAKNKYSAGDTATFTFVRSGETKTAEVTWGTVPPEEEKPADDQQETQNQYQQPYNYYGSNPFDLFDYYFNQR